MRLLIFILISLTAAFASAHQQCLEAGHRATPIHFETTQEFTRNFQNVEVFRRKNNIGLQQYGELKVQKWVETHFSKEGLQSLIGLTTEGRIYQIVYFGPQRTIARLLSGEQNFTDIMLSSQGHLIASKQDGSIHLYSSKKWMQSGLKTTLLRASALWVATSSAMVAIAKSQLEGHAWNSPEILMIGAVISSATLLSVTLNMLNRFQHQNSFPDGFVKTPLQAQMSLAEIKAWLKKTESFNDFSPPQEHRIPGAVPEIATEPIN